MFDGKGAPPGEIAVRAAVKEDSARIAQLHATGINEGFLASLGPRFLRRLYARMVVSRRAFLLVAYDPQGGPTGGGQEAIGFVAGTESVPRLYREFLLRDGAVAGFVAAPQLARAVPRLLETVRYGSKNAQPGEAPTGGAETELLSLAVAPEARRRGAGAQLVDSFHAAARDSGSVSARVVVGATNDAAIRLYQSAGFVEAERFELHAGTESLLLRADLSDRCPR